ncbi:MAG: choice-of-anchor M domain-containing protein, partial [Myxococcota bacterium]|nr:choice-of-anchor M domain-containing protein [Myxococcota bacterium]
DSDLLYFFLSDPMLGRNLSFWDGLGDVDFGPVPDDEVFVGLIPAGFLEFELTVADGADADVGGSLVATTDPGGRLHDHVSFFLYGDDTPVETPGERAADLATPGVYLISLGVAVVDESGAEPTERTAPPGYALFAAGDVDPAALGAATEWVDTVLVPEPSAAAGAAAALAALAFVRGARRRRPARLAALVASLGLVAAGGAARAERLAYSEGHADLQVELVDEGGEPAFFALEGFLRAEGAVIGGELVAGPSDFEAEQIEIAVPDATRESLTEDQIDFFHFQPIGVDAGEPFWRLPQDQGAADDRRAPFLGLAATEIEAGLLEEGRVFLHLVEMEAPAGAVVSAWQTVLGPTPFAISTADGIEEDDFVRLGAGSHAHYNLGFTQPGTYDLTFEPRATLAGSAAPVTGSVTYRFVVPEPSLKAAGLGALAALSLLAACRSGTPARRGR